MASHEKHDSGHCDNGIRTKSESYTREDLNRTCGVCLDVVLRKQPVSQRLFAILPNCNHCFCVACIRTWRKQSSVFSNGVTKGCPECRTVSFYYVPSNCWIEDQADKNTLCLSYKRVMAEIPCRYFLGRGCVFGRKCFYKHSRGSPEYESWFAWAPTNIMYLYCAFIQQGLWLWPCLTWHWH